jgi:hypothetical protein
MHIPDGYLGPSTCVALYGGAAPFWWIALRRMKRALHTRMVPLLSLFSAFSFIVMMFNLPLPGGTTGHAVGVAIATIVLGPWAAILAISIALVRGARRSGRHGVWPPRELRATSRSTYPRWLPPSSSGFSPRFITTRPARLCMRLIRCTLRSRR